MFLIWRCVFKGTLLVDSQMKLPTSRLCFWPPGIPRLLAAIIVAWCEGIYNYYRDDCYTDVIWPPFKFMQIASTTVEKSGQDIRKEFSLPAQFTRRIPAACRGRGGGGGRVEGGFPGRPQLGQVHELELRGDRHCRLARLGLVCPRPGGHQGHFYRHCWPALFLLTFQNQSLISILLQKMSPRRGAGSFTCVRPDGRRTTDCCGEFGGERRADHTVAYGSRLKQTVAHRSRL